MNTAPDKPEGAEPKTQEVARRESIRKTLGLAEDEPLEMPPCDAGYLLGYLFELGPTVAAGMGAGPISHGEIDAWQRNTGIGLSAWECRTLRRLSMDYLAGAHQATARDCPAPWEDAPYAQPVPNLKVERTRNALRALAKL